MKERMTSNAAAGEEAVRRSTPGRQRTVSPRVGPRSRDDTMSTLAIFWTRPFLTPGRRLEPPSGHAVRRLAFLDFGRGQLRLDVSTAVRKGAGVTFPRQEVP